MSVHFNAILIFFLVFFVANPCWSHPSKFINWKHEIEILNHEALDDSEDVPGRLACEPGDDPPPVRVNTTDRLTMLREQMVAKNLDAYIITTSDDHQVQSTSMKRTFKCISNQEVLNQRNAKEYWDLFYIV